MKKFYDAEYDMWFSEETVRVESTVSNHKGSTDSILFTGITVRNPCRTVTLQEETTNPRFLSKAERLKSKYKYTPAIENPTEEDFEILEAYMSKFDDELLHKRLNKYTL